MWIAEGETLWEGNACFLRGGWDHTAKCTRSVSVLRQGSVQEKGAIQDGRKIHLDGIVS
jgi:hypothetical protein